MTFILLALAATHFAYKVLFEDFEELVEAIRYWLTPDLYSLCKGEAMEDFYAELKLGVVLFCGFGTYLGLSGFVGH